MEEKLKNTFFLKKLFFSLNERRKLKLIKYNKNIQKDLDIGLINYIYFTKKYIIYEAKGKGEEYNSYNNKLVYEGEYLNGERNGKGKEYNYNGELIYEGEYLKGKRNGKGREYRHSNRKPNFGLIYILNFEGEYLNGKMWNGKLYGPKNTYNIKDGKGLIKEYYGDDDLKFEGSLLNGERNGKGKEYNYNGKLIYEGEYLNGKRNGKGKEYDYNGNLIYEGEFLNGEKLEIRKDNILNNHKKEFEYDINGNIIEKEYDDYGSLVFEGTFLDGEIWNGIGKQYYYYIKENSNDIQKELIFECEYLYGLIKKGKTYHKGKLEFEGDYFFYQKWNGKGYDENGNVIYELKNGTGKVREYNGIHLVFEGEYLNGEKNGKGKTYYEDGKIFFEGEYLNDKANGRGKEYNKRGEIIYEGEYLNGERNGRGKGKEYLEIKKGKGLFPTPENEEIIINFILLFEGEYLNGKRNGKGKEYNYNGNLLFEGEYLEGKRWNGKGKEYDFNGNLLFEGEYLEGKRWNGKGKEFNNNVLIFEGTYSNGEKSGYVKRYL